MPKVDWKLYSNVKNRRELVVCSMTDQIIERPIIIVSAHSLVNLVARGGLHVLLTVHGMNLFAIILWSLESILSKFP